MKRLTTLLLFFLLVLTACSEAVRVERVVTQPVSADRPAATKQDMPLSQPALTQPSMPVEPVTATEQAAAVTQVAVAVPAVPAATELPAPPAGFPDPAEVTWRPVAGGLEKPISLANAGDGSGRLFVVEQPGRIRIIQDGLLLPGAFLDITDRVGSEGFEQGLLGLAFHPQYAQNGYFFVNYTDLNGDTVIARFQVSAADPQQADSGSEKRLLFVDQPYRNHNGGQVAFGPDGYLYLGLGDGGSAADPQGNGQSLAALLGKILRLDVDGGDPYAIPADNPFASGGGKPEIWAYGLRNPWRFAFDRLTGDLYVGDVGQNQWEEINFLPPGVAGANFGWSFYEGTHPFRSDAVLAVQPVAPVAEYGHNQGCSVTGGVVYRGVLLPAWQGIYLYADYCSGTGWGLYRDGQGNWQSQQLFNGLGAVTAFGEDEAGEVYLLAHGGEVFRLEAK